LILDVGCGNRKAGDVNIDINRQCRPDVVCDIHFLPFIDSAFNHVLCYHVLEHRGVKPRKALKELKRVSSGFVEIQVPHWLSSGARKDKTHANFFVIHERFWHKLKPAKITVDAEYVSRFLPLLARPHTITVQLKAKQV